MENDRLKQATDTLREEEAKLRHQLDEHQRNAKSIEVELTKIQAALAALGGKPAGKAPKAKRKPTKEPATQTEVSNAVADALSKGEMTGDQLKEAIDDRITKSGKSRTGLALRLKQALNDELIEETETGYRLSTAVTT